MAACGCCSVRFADTLANNYRHGCVIVSGLGSCALCVLARSGGCGGGRGLPLGLALWSLVAACGSCSIRFCGHPWEQLSACLGRVILAPVCVCVRVCV